MAAFCWLKEGSLLPFGTLSHPMPGFFPFILGIIWGILSIILLGKSLIRGEKEKIEDLRFFSERKGWQRISLTMGTMLVFYLVFESAGRPNGFLFISFCFI